MVVLRVPEAQGLGNKGSFSGARMGDRTSTGSLRSYLAVIVNVVVHSNWAFEGLENRCFWEFSWGKGCMGWAAAGL